MQFCLEPVDGIAHHVGRDEVAQVIVDDGLGLDVIALGQFFQIEFLGSPGRTTSSAPPRRDKRDRPLRRSICV